MAHLKDRNKQIPNGLRYRVPELNWDSTKVLPPMPSLRTISNAVLALRIANPYVSQKHGWSLRLVDVENTVDEYNAAICLSHGWLDYVRLTSGESPPPTLPPQASNPVVARSLAGVAVNAEMVLGKGPVALPLAETRAKVCVECPKNGKGDWTSYFTEPIAALARKTIEITRGMSLKTSMDDKLGVCTGCGCPLQSKVWAPLDHIIKNMPESDMKQLWEKCWVTNSTE